jgi:hypothetical protein
LDRREFIQLAGLATVGVAGVVFSSGLRGVSLAAEKGRAEDFMFLQMSDLHWGFTGPAINPEAEVTLDKAIAHVNTGDLQDTMFIRGPHDPIKIDPSEGVWLYTDDPRNILDADAGASRERSL